MTPHPAQSSGLTTVSISRVASPAVAVRSHAANIPTRPSKIEGSLLAK